MPEETTSADRTTAVKQPPSGEKAVAKVKIDLKSTKVNKKSVEFNNNNSIVPSSQPGEKSAVVENTVHNNTVNTATTVQSSSRDLSQVRTIIFHSIVI